MRLAVLPRIAAALAASLALVPTQLCAAAFEQVGLGARSLAMGGAAVALTDTYESVFWNPAAIASARERVAHSEYRNLYGLGALRYVTAGYIHPKVGHGSIGFTWLRLDTTGEASYLDYTENALVFTYGTTFFRKLSLGANGKYYRVNSSVGAGGMGLDLGATYVIMEPILVLGASASDVTRTLITWDSGAKDRLPINLRVGISSKIWRRTLLSAQVSWRDQERRSHHAGIEQQLFNKVLALRFGGVERDNSWRFSWGLGVQVKKLQLDYGWEKQEFLGDTQSFALSLKF